MDSEKREEGGNNKVQEMGREQEESKSDVLKLFDQEEENSFNPPRTKPTQL